MANSKRAGFVCLGKCILVVNKADANFRYIHLTLSALVLQIQLFSLALRWVLICDYLLDNAKNQHEFLIRSRQDGHIKFYAQQKNLRS
jgi:hypothetical protein